MRPEHSTHSELAITEHARGSVLAVTVVPRAPRAKIERGVDGAIRIYVSAPPVAGAANTAVLRYLARVLNVPRSRLAITNGEISRRKRILVEGMGFADLSERMHQALDTPDYRR